MFVFFRRELAYTFIDQSVYDEVNDIALLALDNTLEKFHAESV